MPRLAFLVALLSVAAAWALPAAAEPALDLLDARVPYAADFTVTSGRGTYTGQVWHMPGMERRDFATAAGGQALIVRRDQDAAYLLKPAGRWYVALGLRAVGVLAGGIDAMTAERRKVRDETVGGIPATRWKVKAGGPRGGFDGEMWTSRDGIVVKAAGRLGDGADAEPVEMALSGLKVGPVDARLFELPSGWLGMDLRKVPPEKVEQALEGLRPMLQGRGG